MPKNPSTPGSVEPGDNSFSRFLFRATRQAASAPVDDQALLDNLCGELDRLSALCDLLEHVEANPLPVGASLLLRDVWERAWALMELWSQGKGLTETRSASEQDAERP